MCGVVRHGVRLLLNGVSYDRADIFRRPSCADSDGWAPASSVGSKQAFVVDAAGNVLNKIQTWLGGGCEHGICAPHRDT